MPCTTLNDEDSIPHPSFHLNRKEFQPVRPKNQRCDIPMKVIVINRQSLSNKSTSLTNMCESTGAFIVIGTESWLTSNHTNAEVFLSNYKVFRRDRKTSKGVGYSSLLTRSITASRMENYTLITTVRCYGPSFPWLE